jgi:UDP-2,3-diacylglucosamine pyrophosphatase LpxH
VGHEILLVINRHVNRVRRVAGLPYWSLAAYVKGKVKTAVNFVTAFETGLAHEAARRGLQGVVCGHIHRAEMREIEGVLYCNTGDWVESCTALVEGLDGTLELLSMAPARRAAAAPRVALT